MAQKLQNLNMHAPGLSGIKSNQSQQPLIPVNQNQYGIQSTHEIQRQQMKQYSAMGVAAMQQQPFYNQR